MTDPLPLPSTTSIFYAMHERRASTPASSTSHPAHRRAPASNPNTPPSPAHLSRTPSATHLVSSVPLSRLVETSPARPPPPTPLVPLNLLKLASSVVQSRNGSVLSRGYIIKRDYRPIEGLNASPSLQPRPDQVHLTGASNFRGVDELGVYGCAQPTETGLRTILSMLRSSEQEVRGRHVAWFCTREEPVVYLGTVPFVLRDAAHPTKTYSISDRAENLEEIEIRLKADILKEAQRYGGVILVQEEIRQSCLGSNTFSSGEGFECGLTIRFLLSTGPEEIVNTWITADSVRTVREVYESVAASGYHLTYHRTPVTPDQSPEDGYLDTYSELIRKVPITSLLVFNCGLGVVRTTFAMSIAILVRRMQIIREGGQDPLRVEHEERDEEPNETTLLVVGRAKTLLKEKRKQAERDRSLLRLMSVLQNSLATKGQGAALGLLLAQPQLLENLRTALVGQYDLILSLLSVIDDGVKLKRVVDLIVDRCDVMVNLRESVLQHRLRYASLALVDERSSQDHRSKALAALERYFFLVAFASFVDESYTQVPRSKLPSGSPNTPIKFSTWLKDRTEIGKMLRRLTKTGQGHFWVFSPVHDLSAIARGEAGHLAAADRGAVERFAEVQRRGNEVVGDEWAKQIVRVRRQKNRTGIILRPGMILKNDQWRAAESSDDSGIRGAINFRRVPNSSLYGLSQPSEDGIKRVLEKVRQGMDPNAAIVWINLREEPLVVINGNPYVLRQEAISLRNVKSYAGISSSRLELLEDRLKSDVLAELKAFDGRLLLHSEATDGSVNPVWETIEDPSRSVKTLREIFTELSVQVDLVGPSFRFKRIPITAERSPNLEDVKEIVEIVAQLPPDESALIVNCQLGRGRSTRAQIIITLVQRWMRSQGAGLSRDGPRSTRYSYTVINNLLRTIRSGQEVKNAVDEAITACGETFDLLDSIEEARQEAEDAKDNSSLREKHIARGLQSLRSYYFLILFSSFLNESKAETWRELRDTSASYETWVRDRPVFKTIERELDHAGIEALMPLEKPVAGTEGNALSDEVAEFVAKRSGRILSAFTLLKSDFFSGLQKMSLPERVDGAPNFRRVRLPLDANVAAKDLSASVSVDPSTPLVYGSGMPTVDGLRRALERMNAKEKPIVWTSMREEPVIYVDSKPHVLRLFDEPLENVVTTGVTASTVEAMEAALQQDLRREAEANDGKVLLHDETAENGTFIVTAMWEHVPSNAILTPQEVFSMMRDEGFQVDYERLPVTDEQAPLAGVYTRLEERTAAGVRKDANLVFNCQMGRGRTTTGMVAATLVFNILFDPSVISSDLSGSILVDNANGADVSLAWDGRESDPYLAGEYKIVLQLISLLQYGKLAKKLVDRAIDACEGVQNLRKAVYDFKLRAEAADFGTKKHGKIFNVAVNYLYRYASLIVFANYLLEKAFDSEDDEASKEAKPFKQWLAARREISSMLSRKTLE